MVNRPGQPQHYIRCYQKSYKQLYHSKRLCYFDTPDELCNTTHGTTWLLWFLYLSAEYIVYVIVYTSLYEYNVYVYYLYKF